MRVKRVVSLFLFPVVLLTTVWAGSGVVRLCYVQDWGDAAQMGCQPGFHPNPLCKPYLECGPGYQNCAQGSGYHESRIIRTGTHIATEGRQSFAVGADPCYDWISCECHYSTGICVPVARGMDNCATWQAQHAVGGPCP